MHPPRLAIRCSAMHTIVFVTWLMQMQIHVTLPSIRFEAPPPVVEVQPNVYVVPDRDDEVFFVDGWYWTRWNDGRWYRTRDHRGGWVSGAAPLALVRIPPGHYKHHHGKPERMRVIGPDGRVTEYQVKEKHGMVEMKEKGRGNGNGNGNGRGHGKGKWKDRD
jgi:hypothetical protein